LEIARMVMISTMTRTAAAPARLDRRAAATHQKLPVPGSR
jgi:hypothetical protein